MTILRLATIILIITSILNIKSKLGQITKIIIEI